MTTIGRLGEFPFIDAIAVVAHASGDRATGVSVGIGDDAAVVAGFDRTLLTTDVLVEGVHFRSDWLAPADLGRRAFRVAVSDVSAMGGAARYVLLSLVVPPAADARALRATVRALIRDAEDTGAALVGGNVSRGTQLSLTVTVVGECRQSPIRRAGAKPGDAIFVTGSLGAAAAGVELLERGHRRGALVSAYRRPPLRFEAGRALARAGLVTSMIDVSDGLVQDLGHVCRASGVCARIALERLPISRALLQAAAGRSRHGAGGRAAPARRPVRLSRPAIDYALGGGDDYELLFTARDRSAEQRLRRSCRSAGCMITRIGEIVGDRGRTRVMDSRGHVLGAGGYVHFGGRE